MVCYSLTSGRLHFLSVSSYVMLGIWHGCLAQSTSINTKLPPYTGIIKQFFESFPFFFFFFF